MMSKATDPAASDAVVIDARGLRCPWPVLRAARALRDPANGAGVILVADDPLADVELAAFAKSRALSCDRVSTSFGTGYRLAPKWSEQQSVFK